jgi:hypothetical protein
MGWLYFSPLAFRQGNMEGFDVIANDVARAIPGGSKVCELYAGVGLLGLTSLIYHHSNGKPLIWVRCSDENPANPRCFTRSLQSMYESIIDSQGSFVASCSSIECLTPLRCSLFILLHTDRMR